MEQYHVLLREILGRGDVQFEPRTQEYILGKSGWRSEYDVRETFPLMTTKNVPPRLPFEEVFWKLRGERNVQSLVKKNIHFWTKNAFDKYLRENDLSERVPKHTQEWNDAFDAYKKMLVVDPEKVGEGDLGPVYGYQWRHWRRTVFVPNHSEKDNINNVEWISSDFGIEEIDQLKGIIEGIKKSPGSRYNLLSAWNVGDLEEMALGPCPFWHQFSVWANGYMDLAMGQRSCDSFLGVPFNIAQDALLLHMVANETGYKPRFLSTQLFNVHAYLGVPPRSDFWMDNANVAEFQEKFNSILPEGRRFTGYLDLKDWYLKTAPNESKGNEGKDHIPLILEQLSIIPRPLPYLEIKKEIPLLKAIEMPAVDYKGEAGYAKIIGYDPAKWNSKADMAV